MKKFPLPGFNPDDHPVVADTVEFTNLIHDYVRRIAAAEAEATATMIAMALEDETKPGIKVHTRYSYDESTNYVRAEQTIDFDADVPRGEVHYSTDTSGFGVGPYQP